MFYMTGAQTPPGGVGPPGAPHHELHRRPGPGGGTQVTVNVTVPNGSGGPLPRPAEGVFGGPGDGNRLRHGHRTHRGDADGAVPPLRFLAGPSSGGADPGGPPHPYPPPAWLTASELAVKLGAGACREGGEQASLLALAPAPGPPSGGVRSAPRPPGGPRPGVPLPGLGPPGGRRALGKPPALPVAPRGPSVPYPTACAPTARQGGPGGDRAADRLGALGAGPGGDARLPQGHRGAGVLMRVPRLRRRGDPRRGLPPDAPPRGGARPAALTVLHATSQARHRLRPGGARAPGPQLGADRARDRGAGVPSRPPPSRAFGTPHPVRDRARGARLSTSHLDQLGPAGGAPRSTGSARGSPSRPPRCGPIWPGSTSAPCPPPARPGCASAPHPDDPRCPPCWRGGAHHRQHRGPPRLRPRPRGGQRDALRQGCVAEMGVDVNARSAP